MKVENIELSQDALERLDSLLKRIPERSNTSKFNLVRRLFGHPCSECKVVPATKRIKHRRYGALVVEYYCNSCLEHRNVKVRLLDTGKRNECFALRISMPTTDYKPTKKSNKKSRGDVRQ